MTKLGYNSLRELLEAYPDVVRMEMVPRTGQIQVFVVRNERIATLVDLIDRT